MSSRILLLGLLLSLGYSLGAVRPATTHIDYATFAELPLRQMEERIGHKFNLREKIIYRAMKRRIRRQLKHNPEAAQRVLHLAAEATPDTSQLSGLAIASFGAAVGSLLLFLVQPVASILLCLLAVGIGIGALVQLRKQEGRLHGKGFALAGLILGGLILLVFVGVILSFGAG